MPYVNEKDQTPGFEGADELTLQYDEGTPAKRAVRDENGDVTEDAVKGVGGTCRCGCGEAVPWGSLYRPGHDARLKGKLLRAHLAGVKVNVNGKSMTAAKAAELENFAPKGSVAALANGLEKAKLAARSGEEKAAAREEAKVQRAAEREARKAELAAEKAAKEAAAV